MKRHIKLRQYISIILAFIIVFSFIFQSTYASTSQPLLKKYMHSPEVTFLQSDLKRLGYFNQDTTDYFGDITEAAVIKFQKDHGINPDGKINSDTYNKIDILLNGLVLKKGMSGSAITAIQSDLKKFKYFNQDPTGYFGDITETALKNVQKQNSLVVTGVAGILTHSKIDILLKKPTAIKIVIDPGHGGIDKGTTSNGNIVESEVNLNIAKKLKNYLDQKGYNIVLTRNKDIALDSLSSISGTRQQRDLNARTNIINKSNAKMFISVHVNSCPESPSTSGSIVFYNEKLPESKIIAQNIQKALNGITIPNFKRETTGCAEENFYLLRNSNIPGVLVETAFVTNTKELSLLSNEAFKDKIAQAIASGIENSDLN